MRTDKCMVHLLVFIEKTVTEIHHLLTGMDDEDNDTLQLHEVLNDDLRVSYFKGYLAAVSEAIKYVCLSLAIPTMLYKCSQYLLVACINIFCVFNHMCPPVFLSFQVFKSLVVIGRMAFHFLTQ